MHFRDERHGSNDVELQFLSLNSNLEKNSKLPEIQYSVSSTEFYPFKCQFQKMVKHTQTIRRQISEVIFD